MDVELLADDLPTQPPDNLVKWVTENIIHNAHALIYRAGWYVDPLTDIKESCVDARCSICGKTMKLDKAEVGCSRAYASAPFGFYAPPGEAAIDGNTLLCPCCKQPVTAIYAGHVHGSYLIASSVSLVIMPILGRLALIYWVVRRYVDDSAHESVEVSPHAAYVVENKKINCFSFSRSWQKCHQYKDRAGKLAAVFPWDEDALYGTTAENSKLNLYLKCEGSLYPVSYLRLWVQRPRVENLLVQGAGHLVQEMIERDCTRGYHGWNGEVNIPKLEDVCWRERRPSQMLGLTKDVFRVAVAQKWNVAELNTFKAIHSRGEKFDLSGDMKAIRKCGLENVDRLIKHGGDCNVLKSVKYLLKQKKRDAVTLTDYWRLVALNGGDLRSNAVRYPQNLKTAHDNESARQRYLENEGYVEQFAKRTAHLSAFQYESDGFLIRPVASAEELYKEGEQLHHCVYSYLKRHAYGETAIFVIRRSEYPTQPYFTLELDERQMRVLQNRGLRNCDRTLEVLEFEKKWLQWAKTVKTEGSKVA